MKVKLKNELSAPVSVHWHGYPVPNNMDGIPGVTQDAVEPGKVSPMNLKRTYQERTGITRIKIL